MGGSCFDLEGSAFKNTKRRSRHIKSQMKFFSKTRPVRRGKFLSWK